MPEEIIGSLPLDNTLHVVVTREPFIDFYTIKMDDGNSEEFEIEECREWFRERGANMDKVEKALDHVWNFHQAEMVIVNPKEPPRPKLAHSPKI